MEGNGLSSIGAVISYNPGKGGEVEGVSACFSPVDVGSIKQGQEYWLFDDSLLPGGVHGYRRATITEVSANGSADSIYYYDGPTSRGHTRDASDIRALSNPEMLEKLLRNDRDGKLTKR